MSPCEIRSFIINKQICPLEVALTAAPSFLNYGNTTYYSVPAPVDVHVRCTLMGKVHAKHQQIDGIGSFQAHTGCITQVTELAQVRPIHIAEIHDLASDTIFGVLKQFDFSSVTYPPDQNLQNTTTQKPLTILTVNDFSEGVKLLFDVQTNSTDVVRAFMVIFLLIAIFLIFYSCNKTFRLWFNDCLSFTKPQKYWSRKYDNVPHFIRNPNSNNGQGHERISKILSAIKKPFAKEVVVVQPTTTNAVYTDDTKLTPTSPSPNTYA